MLVIVTGCVATYPVGGVAWDYLQYVQGFQRLGCDVHYLEDTGQWLYDPDAATFTADAAGSSRYVQNCLATLDARLARRWAVRGPDGRLTASRRRPWRACARRPISSSTCPAPAGFGSRTARHG